MSKLVSILIPVFNEEKSIAGCIDSILNQSYSNFELLLYFDGSTDSSYQIAAGYNEERIKIIEGKVNVGIASARNKLVAMANGEFIAWMDADDRMLPNRLTEQVRFLERNKEIDICGSAALLRNSDVKEQIFLKEHDLIHAFNYFKCSTLFPTIMTRNFYHDPRYLFNDSFGSRASDFEWLYRVGAMKKITNLSKPTLSYYVSSESELNEKKRKNEFERKMTGLLCEKLNLLSLSYEKDEIILLHNFLLSNFELKETESAILIRIMEEVKLANLHHKLHPVKPFETVLLFLMIRVKRNSQKGKLAWGTIFKQFKCNALWNVLWKKSQFP